MMLHVSYEYAAKMPHRVMEEDEYEKLKKLGVKFDA
jgi:hypothetical protein